MFSEKPFSSTTADNILYLIDNKISEQKTLEYKRQLPDKDKEDAKIKILQSITSFTNTDGGIIIFGMMENDDGEAAEIKNIDSPTDDDFLRLQNLIKDRIEPRMTPPELRELYVNDQKIYLMKIQPSFNKLYFVKNKFIFSAKLAYWTCLGTRLVPFQVLQFLRQKPCETAFLSGSCSETEVSEQLYCFDILWNANGYAKSLNNTQEASHAQA